MRSTLALLSKASRAPLTSKQANKEFYKGTGSFPGLGPKRQGRHSPGSKAPYILMQERMRTFVVPDNLNSCGVRPTFLALCFLKRFGKHSTDTLTPAATAQLKPYVAKTVKVDPRASNWPMADTKPSLDSKRGGLFGPNGFDGHYYLQLAEAMGRGERGNKA
ncbi:hypothetical protein DMC30DRAFT_348524 [Rhodotorula diobovata]|uniref:Mitochondrial ribosomal protein L27-domain-containing protein n=1 Tax=Rhodotorula diobovata TaxID=5288 RepID=A0A5C5G2I0_9BASI|nr:hypothetical protein DMC30DRAFT_348524 [Rhodotorula diobovata]